MKNKNLVLLLVSFLSCEVADAGPVCSKPALPAITTRTQPAQASSTTQEQVVGSTSAVAVQSLAPVVHERTFHRYVELSQQCPRVQRLIGEFHGIYTCDREGWFPIHKAALDGDTDKIQILTALGADLKVRTINRDWPEDFHTPLDLALTFAASDKTKKVQEQMKRASILAYLLEHGADGNVVSEGRTGTTIVHKALIWRNIPALHVLIERGVDLNQKDKYDIVPLDHARREAGCLDNCLEYRQEIQKICKIIQDAINSQEYCGFK